MQPEIEKIIGTLEILTQPSLRCNLPGHEYAANFVPFVWDVSEWGNFNIRNLCLSNGWLEITDADATVKQWQNMKYPRNFPDFNVSLEQRNLWRNKIDFLFQLLQNNLTTLESFFLVFKFEVDGGIYLPGMLIGETKDGDWVGVSHTIYKETEITQEIIDRSEQIEIDSNILLEENTVDLIAKIQAITSELGTINFSGDRGGGDYPYNYDHKIVLTAAKTKELVFEKILQATECLEINHFYSFHPDIEYLRDWCYFQENEAEKMYHRYNTINRFFQHTFEQTFIYRFSFWTRECIYVLGQTQGKNLAGVYIEGDFTYNP
ncbi:nuclease A inhibitor family protein [Okeania sp. KiyG1]|uniref:nuclease A inhibitor family protein n=1 Tax=Okeania sp. KiyG1 TaxID=2720165 RepID=UPI0019211FB8|nr:nuclease A inhibitor family protein [Okeania sp. KiyG1]GGA06772.1 hypothetical protein CYANOKiyG1_19140 [Okeania sp. KiyG1]